LDHLLDIKNVTLISTTPLSEVMTTSTTTIGTLGAITDPELVRFQNELDRRYFNLNKKEEVKDGMPGFAKFLLFLLIAVVLVILAYGARYYHLRYERLKSSDIVMESGDVTLTLQRLKK